MTERTHFRPAERASAAVRLLAVLVLGITAALSAPGADAQADAPIRIGIIGTGNIGGGLAMHWARAGHELVISSRHPEELEPLADTLGPRVRTGTPREAAAFGDVVLVSVPYAAMPQIGRDFAAELEGKIVLDTGNPIVDRDGEMARAALDKGSGVASAELLPGTRLVRAFNCIPAEALRNEANREPEPHAIPLAGDDAEALRVAERLVEDAGFAPVVVGGLETARYFDLGEPLAQGLRTADELRAAIDELGL